MIKLKSMVVFTKYVVKTEISIYLMAFLNKTRLKRLILSSRKTRIAFKQENYGKIRKW